MVRNKILFSGQSNTFGLGLEVEFRPKYNDDEWLKENGLIIPLPREPEDEYYWKKYRWTGLVCKELGYEEINVHDIKDIPIGGDGIQTCWMLQNKNSFSDLMDGVKYVIFEMGGIRWYDEGLHGKDSSYPNTALEIIKFLDSPPVFSKNPNGTPEYEKYNTKVSQAHNWLMEMEPDIYYQEVTRRYLQLKSLYPDVTFLMLKWNEWDSYDKKIKHDLIDLGTLKNDNGEILNSVHDILQRKELCIYQSTKAFNGDYKTGEPDHHASSKGHEWVAKRVIKHIRKLEEN